jgi:hypothetical protein
MSVGEGMGVAVGLGPTVGAIVGDGDGEPTQPAIISADIVTIKASTQVICFMLPLRYFVFARLVTHYRYNGIGQ